MKAMGDVSHYTYWVVYILVSADGTVSEQEYSFLIDPARRSKMDSTFRLLASKNVGKYCYIDVWGDVVFTHDNRFAADEKVLGVVTDYRLDGVVTHYN